MRIFVSDNNSGVHPRILDALDEANRGHQPSYGNDSYTEKAIDLFRQAFQKDLDVYFVTSGTAANIIGLTGLLQPFEGVVCPDTAHINTDECGAFERFGGNKLIYIGNKNGKIYPEDIRGLLGSRGDEHRVEPRLISISQVTELGSLYTVEEIRALADFAHENHMYLHIDGARIANAVVALDSSFKEMISDTGVDLLSFGGTKNGMMMGEAIVSFNKELSKNFKYIRKQGMQLISKMRFMSAQFIPYLEEEIWEENARNSNQMAEYLKDELIKNFNVSVDPGQEANIIFAQFPDKYRDLLAREFSTFEMDGENNIIRLVTSFDTRKKDVDNFVGEIKALIKT